MFHAHEFKVQFRFKFPKSQAYCWLNFHNMCVLCQRCAFCCIKMFTFLLPNLYFSSSPTVFWRFLKRIISTLKHFRCLAFVWYLCHKQKHFTRKTRRFDPTGKMSIWWWYYCVVFFCVDGCCANAAFRVITSWCEVVPAAGGVRTKYYTKTVKA